jgi:hypothetical protein
MPLTEFAALERNAIREDLRPLYERELRRREAEEGVSVKRPRPGPPLLGSVLAGESRWVSYKVLDEGIPLYSSDSGDQILAQLVGRPVIGIGSRSGDRVIASLEDGARMGWVDADVSLYQVRLMILKNSTPILAEPRANSRIVATLPDGKFVEAVGKAVQTDGEWLPVRLADGAEGWMRGKTKVRISGASVRIHSAESGDNRTGLFTDGRLQLVSGVVKQIAQERNSQIIGVVCGAIAMFATAVSLSDARGPMLDIVAVVALRAALGYGAGFGLGRVIAFFDK